MDTILKQVTAELGVIAFLGGEKSGIVWDQSGPNGWSLPFGFGMTESLPSQ